jgi:hypothetical protein
VDVVSARDPMRGWGSHLWYCLTVAGGAVVHLAIEVGAYGDRPAGHRARCGSFLSDAEPVGPPERWGEVLRRCARCFA